MLKVINIGIWLDCKHKLNNNGAANYYDSAYQIFKENTFGNVNIKFISSKKNFDIDIIKFDPAYAIIIHKLFSTSPKHQSGLLLIHEVWHFGITIYWQLNHK